jgi:hypothetical protein
MSSVALRMLTARSWTSRRAISGSWSPDATNFHGIRPLHDDDLLQVHGVAGEEWAEPLHTSNVRMKIPSQETR